MTVTVCCMCALHAASHHWHTCRSGALGGLGGGGVGGGAKTQPVLFHLAVAPSPLPLMTERGTYGGFSRLSMFASVDDPRWPLRLIGLSMCDELVMRPD